MACVLRATTKTILKNNKVVDFFDEQKVHHGKENPGYAYEFTHP